MTTNKPFFSALLVRSSCIHDECMTLKAKAKAKDSKFVLEDTPRTKAKDNNTAFIWCDQALRNNLPVEL